VVDVGEWNNDRTTMHEDNNDNNKEIIDGEGVAEWEDFMADYRRMLPPPLYAAGGGGGEGSEGSDVAGGNRCEAVLGGPGP
jgi:hypothetical protein